MADAISHEVAGATVPFAVHFHCVGSFASNRDRCPFVLRDRGDNDALLTFHGRLWFALGGHGQPRFTPHVTLHYNRQLVAEAEVKPVRWMVRKLVLIHSFVGQSRYETLGRWPLQGGN